jgi:ABC-2 type transport system permease protein
MRVFKLYYRLILNRKWTIIGFVCLLILSLVSWNDYGKNNLHEQFTPVLKELKIGIVYEDEEDPVIQSLISHFESSATVRRVENNEEKMIDDVYKMKADEIIVFPKNYGNDLLKASFDHDMGLPKLRRVSGRLTEVSLYIDQMISNYVGNFLVAALEVENIESQQELSAMLTRLEKSLQHKVDITQIKEEGKSDIQLFSMGSCMISFLFFTILTICFGAPALAMGKETIIVRESMSSMTHSTRNKEFFLASTSFALLVWTLSMSLMVLIFGPQMLFHTSGQLILLGSFLATFGLSGIAFLMATISANQSVLIFLQVTIGLMIHFGSGIFVPRELVGEAFQKLVSVASPIWQVKANELILSAKTLTNNRLDEIKNYFFIMLLIGLAYYAVSFVIMRFRNVENN